MTDSAAVRVPEPGFWRGRRVLITGHTGFKGSWITALLTEFGAVTAGLALPEMPTQPALWESLGITLAADIRADLCSDDWKNSISEFDPHVIIHLAAQSLVSEGYAAPYRTHATNIMGTANLLDTTRRLTSLESILVATTDKVYDNGGQPPYAESSRLGGTDPYSASKVGTELVVHSWPGLPCPVVTARAGNVIGGGDWGRDRLIPDLVRSWSTGSEVVLRRPGAVRPWQHVLEPLGGYLIYLEELASNPALPRSMNFGPSVDQSVRVQDVVDLAAHEWARAFDLETPPISVTGDPSAMVETDTLAIDSNQAHERLGWRSTLGWQAAVSMTIAWYAEFVGTGQGSATLLAQLREYGGLGDRVRRG